MNTELSQKSISKTYQTKVLLTILEVALLILIGSIGVLLHAKFRVPLKMPGHWGVVYMALLFSGRLFSKKPYASSLSSIGAAAMLLLPLGFKDPFMPVLYLFPGYLVDIFYNLFKAKNYHVVFVALLSGFAYMTLPLTRMIISLATGAVFGSFVNGYFYPFVMHFVFGMIGGLIGLSIFRLIKRKQ